MSMLKTYNELIEYVKTFGITYGCSYDVTTMDLNYIIELLRDTEYNMDCRSNIYRTIDSNIYSKNNIDDVVNKLLKTIEESLGYIESDRLIIPSSSFIDKQREKLKELEEKYNKDRRKILDSIKDMELMRVNIILEIVSKHKIELLCELDKFLFIKEVKEGNSSSAFTIKLLNKDKDVSPIYEIFYNNDDHTLSVYFNGSDNDQDKIKIEKTLDDFMNKYTREVD